MEDYYYVPINQIKPNQDIYDINIYAGYNIYNYDNTINRVKGRNLEDLKLIVSYKKGAKEAYEILTGQPISVIDITIENNEISWQNSFNNPHQYTDDAVNIAALYIVNKTIITDDNKQESLLFNDNNNLAKMDYHQALKILEIYKRIHTEKSMTALLEMLRYNGLINAKKALENYEAKKTKEDNEIKHIQSLIKKLKNQS